MDILDVNEIRKILPHRYPMLLVDRIVELEAERIVGIEYLHIRCDELSQLGDSLGDAHAEPAKRRGVQRSHVRLLGPVRL